MHRHICNICSNRTTTTNATPLVCDGDDAAVEIIAWCIARIVVVVAHTGWADSGDEISGAVAADKINMTTGWRYRASGDEE